MSFPAPVAKYVQREILRAAQPLCLLIDRDYRLLDTWGDPIWCEVNAVRKGIDARESFEFLTGYPIDEAGVLKFVGSRQHGVLHVHMIPEGDGCYVVLIDASAEHDAMQSTQQSMNELRLMDVSQNLLIQRQRDLISELVETRAELDHRRQETERVSANKSRFIATMSHEFRTPLASIINYVDLANEPGASGDTMQKSLQTIERSARHLTSLVDALLDDASLSVGMLELQENSFDCYLLFEDIASMMAPLAAEKGLSFATLIDPDVPRTLYADEVRLRQVLINLLGNAIKFTIEGGARLVVSYRQQSLVLTIADTGPGISEKDRQRVFEAFERGSRRGETGAGLGLTITLRLVELMRGEMSLDSVPGNGCTVTVQVPVMRHGPQESVEEPILPTPGDDAQASSPRSVLVCDDDDDMVALIEHYLHRLGYGLITSSNTSDAIAKTIKFDPDLVLMDCNVPGVGGVDAARVLRERGYNKPIVALTASKLRGQDQQVFTRFFRKPTPMHELLSEIKRLTH